MKIIQYKYKIPNYSKSFWASRDFYELFKSSFINGTPIDIITVYGDSETNYDKYVIELYFDFEKKYRLDKNFNDFKTAYNKIKLIYDARLRWSSYDSFVELLIEEKKYEEALKEWITLREEERSINIDFTYRDSEIFSLIKFENFLNRGIIDGYLINRIAPKGSQLTHFGKRNLESIFIHISIIIKETSDESFFERFFENYSFNNNQNLTTYNYQYYEKFFKHNDESKELWNWLISIDKLNEENRPARMNANPFILKNKKVSSQFIAHAIRSESSRILRESENNYRLSIGSKKIGEEWISETELFYKIKSHFNTLEVIQHGRPNWLGRQHFDIWIPELKIAIEYQGQQHDKPIDYFGGQKAFEQNKKRDEKKKKKCIENKIILIEVRSNYEIKDIITKIKSAN